MGRFFSDNIPATTSPLPPPAPLPIPIERHLGSQRRRTRLRYLNAIEMICHLQTLGHPKPDGRHGELETRSVASVILNEGIEIKVLHSVSRPAHV